MMHQAQSFEPSVTQPTVREAIIDDILIEEMFPGTQAGYSENLMSGVPLPNIVMEKQEFVRKLPFLFYYVRDIINIFKLIFQLIEAIQLFMPATEQYMKITGAYDLQIPKYSGAQAGDLSSESQVHYKLSALTSKRMLNVPNY